MGDYEQDTIDELETEIAQLHRLIAAWRTALRRIANQNSGPWGWIAKDALDKERKMSR